MTEEIKRICFIGAGTQGCMISLICSSRGYESVLYDVSSEVLNQVSMRQQFMGAFMIERGYFDKERFESALSRISTEADLERAVKGADLINESVHERLATKRKVHQQLDEISDEQTILTTNTSSLLVSDIEGSVKRGDRFAALHFYGTRPMADVVGGPRTSAETIDLLKRFVRSLGMWPVVLKKEKDGYLGNSMLISNFKTAMLLVVDGHADFEDVDRTWMILQGSELGPFGQADAIGLNVALDVFEEEAARNQKTSEDSMKVADYIRPYVERGELGVKTGKGFYSYPDPTFRKAGFLKGE